MNLLQNRALSTAVAVGALTTGAFTIVPTTASAAEHAPMRCEGYTYIRVFKFGKPYYASRGPVVSKRNSSSSKATLVYSIKTTKTQKTAWSTATDFSISKVSLEIKKTFNKEITKKAAKGRTVTNRMTVDPGKRGYTQPMVEFQRYRVERWRELWDCSHKWAEDIGILKGITSSLHFAECQTKKASCTPKP